MSNLKKTKMLGGSSHSKDPRGPTVEDFALHKSKRQSMEKNKKEETPKPLDFMKQSEEENREAELNLLTTIERQTLGVLGELEYIADRLETHKKAQAKTKGKRAKGKVENVRKKIKDAYNRIQAYMAAENQAELDAIANKRDSGGINLEQNPLIRDLGGLPLEIISSEWAENVSNVLDKTELQNLIRNKLQAKLKLAAQLRARNKPTNQPKPASPAITPKYKKLEKTLDNILKAIPQPEPEPRPAPIFTPDKPRPR